MMIELSLTLYRILNLPKDKLTLGAEVEMRNEFTNTKKMDKNE
jgi:hypothetical protein